MDVNNLGMFLQSLVTSHFQITNPYLIGLMSTFIFWALNKIKNEGVARYIYKNKKGVYLRITSKNKMYKDLSRYLLEHLEVNAVEYNEHEYCFLTETKDDNSMYFNFDRGIPFLPIKINVSIKNDLIILSSTQVTLQVLFDICDEICGKIEKDLSISDDPKYKTIKYLYINKRLDDCHPWYSGTSIEYPYLFDFFISKNVTALEYHTYLDLYNGNKVKKHLGVYQHDKKDAKHTSNFQKITSVEYNGFVIHVAFGKDLIILSGSCNVDLMIEYCESIVKDMKKLEKDIALEQRYLYKYTRIESKMEWKKTKLDTVKTWENIFTGDNIKQELQQDINNFISSKDLYKSKGIPYSRGYFLYGEPGCGKTSIAKTIARSFDKDVYILNMSLIIDDQNLESCVGCIKPGSIIIMEDIDSIEACRKRNFKEKKEDATLSIKSLSLSAILNFIDGIEENDFIFIMTTNHQEILDPALIRPGRFDFSVEIKKCTNETFKELFKFYCDSELPKEHGIPDYHFSIAFLVDLCFRNRDDINKIFKILNEHKEKVAKENDTFILDR